MLASDVIARARGTLFDTTAPFRWSDSELLLWLSDGLRELWNRRPDACYVTGIIVAAPAAVATTTATVGARDEFTAALADYLCFRAFSRDSDDQASTARAQQYLKLFAAEIS